MLHFPTTGHHWRINLGLAMNADMFVINKEEESTTDAVHMGTIGSGVWSRLMNVAACYEQPVAKTFIPISLAESMTNVNNTVWQA